MLSKQAFKLMAKIKIYLDARHLSVKSGEAPLKLALSHQTRTAYIPLNITIQPKYWDAAKEAVIGHSRRKTLNDQIKSEAVKMMAALHEVESRFDINGMSVNELRDRVIEYANPNRIKIGEKPSFSKMFKSFIELKAGNTKLTYQSTYRKISRFMGKKVDTLRFEDINVDWLRRFDAFLAATSPSANARAVSMRNIRAVFNYAIDNEVTTHYPFRRYKITYEKTRKRNFDVETLRAIFNAENISPKMVKYRDMFKLMFMLIGINFVDLCNLQEIRDGRIEYVRSKTKKLYSIKVEPEMEEIIAKYRGDKRLLNYMDSYSHYRHLYDDARKGLHIIENKLNEIDGIEIDTLTSYWARHSWATIAASLDIPKETIAAGLGHSDRSVTDVYIEFDKRKVDVANRRVLNYVLYGYEGGYAPEPKAGKGKKK